MDLRHCLYFSCSAVSNICVPPETFAQYKHHNSKSRVFTSVDLIAGHQRRLRICLRTSGVTKDWGEKKNIHHFGSKLASSLTQQLSEAVLRQGYHILLPLPISSPCWLLLVPKIWALITIQKQKASSFQMKPDMIQTLRQIKLEFPEREFQHCPCWFYFSILHLTNGFVLKSKFMTHLQTLKKSFLVVLSVNRVLTFKVKD